MRPPCESIVTAVLPALRSLIAKELIEQYSFSQVKAARKLGITQAAISQYLSQKRGNQLTTTLNALPEVRSAVLKMAENIASATSSPIDNMMVTCSICGVLRMKEGVACSLHKIAMKLPQDCHICQE